MPRECARSRSEGRSRPARHALRSPESRSCSDCRHYDHAMPRRAALLAVLAAVISLTAATAPVGAEVRIGSNLISQPDTAGVCGPTECTAGNIALPPAKRALQGVLSPVNGTIASWLYRAGASSPNPISLQVLHPNGGLSFTATGTSSAVPVVGGVQGQFGTALPIGIGDAIGLRTQGAQVLTSGIAGATQISWTSPALAQGSTRDGAVTADVETLVQAIIAPTSSVGFGAIERRKKKGTAGIRVSVPNAGTLSYSGLGV